MLVFETAEKVRKVTTETIEDKKWLLFPNYLRSVVRTYRDGAIPPTIKPEWVLAAALKNIEDYRMSKIKKTEN